MKKKTISRELHRKKFSIIGFDCTEYIVHMTINLLDCGLFEIFHSFSAINFSWFKVRGCCSNTLLFHMLNTYSIIHRSGEFGGLPLKWHKGWPANPSWTISLLLIQFCTFLHVCDFQLSPSKMKLIFGCVRCKSPNIGKKFFKCINYRISICLSLSKIECTYEK